MQDNIVVARTKVLLGCQPNPIEAPKLAPTSSLAGTAATGSNHDERPVLILRVVVVAEHGLTLLPHIQAFAEIDHPFALLEVEGGMGAMAEGVLDFGVAA